jgi:hypothetical protein
MRTEATSPGQHDELARSANDSRIAGVALAIILFAYCAYAALFIYRTSFVVDGKRCFCLFDDAMIPMRYARNLAHGQGLLWNPGGERVEGFTNPLWVLFMSLFHLLPIPTYFLSLPIQISGALLVLLTALYVRRIAHALSYGSQLAALSAVALTAFYAPLVNWSLQGMEVSLLAALAAASAYHMATSLARRQFSVVPYALLGVAVLVRMDACVLLAASTLWGIISDNRHRTRHALAGIAAIALCAGSQTIFRLGYYGDLLPNTYYLKMTGYPASLRVLKGLLSLLGFLERLPWWLLVAAFLPFIWRRDRGRMLLVALFSAQCLYSMYVGGDAWEWWGGANRYLAVVMPLFFVLVSLGAADLISWAVVRLKARPRPLLFAARAAGAALVLAFLVASNSFSSTSLRQWLLLEPPLLRDDNALNVKTAELIRAVTTDRALIALSWAGAIPYFSNRNSHDLLGKCDRRIAHERAHAISEWTAADSFVPGHLKWDFDYSILKLHPDIVLRDVSSGRAQKAAFLARYESFYLGQQEIHARLGSPNIVWRTLYQVDAEQKRRLSAGRPPT